MIILLAALLLAQPMPPQTVTPVGISAPNAVTVQGAAGAVPIPITGSISVTGTADTVGNTATFSANNVCTSVLTAGEQSVGFHLGAGTVAASFTPYYTQATGAVNCATAGTCTATTFASGTTPLTTTNPNAVQDLGINLTGGIRQVEVCTTAYTSGSATGNVTATFVQAAISGGGGGGTVTQGNAGTNAAAWWVRIGDTTNGPVAVKPASTAATGTDVALVVAVSPNNTVTVTGTVTANAGTGTFVTSSAAQDPSFVAPGSTSAPTKGGVVMGKTADGTPAYDPIPLAAGGGSVVVSGTVAISGTIPVSGTIAATQSGTWNIGTVTTLSTITNPVTVAQATAANLNATVTGTVAATQSGTWNITNISGTVSLPTGASTETTLAKLPLAQASTTSGQSGPLVQCAVTTSAPTYSSTTTNPLSCDTSGNLRITGSITASNPSVSSTGSAVPASATYIGGNKSGTLTGITLDSSGNVNVNVAAGGGSGGTSSSFSSAFPATGTAAGMTDGTNMQPFKAESSSNLNLRVGIFNGATEAAVKAASTAAVAADPALVVAISPNNTINALITTTVGTPITLNAACATGLTCAAGSTAQVSLTGLNNGNVTFASGSTPLMTLVGDCSYDSGTTWILTGTPSTSGVLGFATAVNVASNTVVNPANTSYVLPINSSACLGATDIRVRVAAYTSGSVSATLRAVFNGGGGGGGGASSNVNISSYGGTATSLGQKTSSASIPVVLPSDAVAQNTSGGPTTISVACSDANLNACASNSFARFTVTGQASAQVQFANSTLTCATARADYLGADGATWVLGGFFNDTSGNVTTSVAFSASSATVNYGLSTPPTVNTTQFQIRCATAITNTTAVSASAGLFGSPPAPYAFPASGAAISPMAIAAYPEHATGFSCNVDAASAETQCIGLSGAGLKYYVKTAVFTSNAAITVKLHSSTTAGNACATSPSLVVPTLYLGTNTGAPLQFPQGLPAAAANSALCCFFSGASGSCVISGYIAP